MVATTANAPEYADQSARVTLCIPHNPVLDLVARAEKRGQVRGPLQELLGGSLDEMREVYRQASPFHRAGPDTPPTLFLHGGADTVIPCEQSVAMHERLLALGVHSEIEIWPGKGHGWFNRAPDFAAVLERMERFLVERFGVE